MPSFDSSGSVISRAATASVIAGAFCRNDIAASFFLLFAGLAGEQPLASVDQRGNKCNPRGNCNKKSLTSFS
jgi:hypothetical protein